MSRERAKPKKKIVKRDCVKPLQYEGRKTAIATRKKINDNEITVEELMCHFGKQNGDREFYASATSEDRSINIIVSGHKRDIVNLSFCSALERIGFVVTNEDYPTEKWMKWGKRK